MTSAAAPRGSLWREGGDDGEPEGVGEALLDPDMPGIETIATFIAAMWFMSATGFIPTIWVIPDMCIIPVWLARSQVLVHGAPAFASCEAIAKQAAVTITIDKASAGFII